MPSWTTAEPRFYTEGWGCKDGPGNIDEQDLSSVLFIPQEPAVSVTLVLVGTCTPHAHSHTHTFTPTDSKSLKNSKEAFFFKASFDVPS